MLCPHSLLNSAGGNGGNCFLSKSHLELMSLTSWMSVLLTRVLGKGTISFLPFAVFCIELSMCSQYQLAGVLRPCLAVPSIHLCPPQLSLGGSKLLRPKLSKLVGHRQHAAFEETPVYYCPSATPLFLLWWWPRSTSSSVLTFSSCLPAPAQQKWCSGRVLGCLA